METSQVPSDSSALAGTLPRSVHPVPAAPFGPTGEKFHTNNPKDHEISFYFLVVLLCETFTWCSFDIVRVASKQRCLTDNLTRCSWTP